MEKEVILEMKDITKRFPGVLALDKVRLTLHKGEILALIGENGAGKSTLMNILYGALRPDEGSIVFDGKPYSPNSPLDSFREGISMIHQELKLVPMMTVSENIWLGQERLFTRYGLLNKKSRDKRSAQLLEQLGIEIPVNRQIRSLSPAEMQLVELARAVSGNAKVIIMDEPTSSLASREIEILYNIIRMLAARDISIIFITHKLDEIETVCDSVTVMRDGHYIDSKPVKEITREEMITKIVGRKVDVLYPKQEAKIGDVMLEVKNFTKRGAFRDISFSVREGEVLGFCGLVGAGRTELMECVFGISQPDEGRLLYKGREIKIKSPRDAIAHGISMVTEDRMRRGLVQMHSIASNMKLAYMDGITNRLGFVDDNRGDVQCREKCAELAVKCSGLKQLARQLSGGNQQKVILGKWLLTNPDIFILDEPTRGIDVGAKAEIYEIVNKLALDGRAVLLVSSELVELTGVCDRILVMREGRMMAEVERKEFSEELLISYAFGQRRQDA